MERKSINLDNVTLFWAALRERNAMSDKFQVDICDLSPDQINALEELGVKPRTKDDDRGYFVTAKSAKFPIIPHDTQGNEIQALIANGSKANVKGEVYGWTHAPTKRSGFSLGIKIGGLTVTDLQEYTPASEDYEEAL
jgi:hypothetical protein